MKNNIKSIQELGNASDLTLGYAQGTLLEYDKPVNGPRGFRLPPFWPGK